MAIKIQGSTIIDDSRKVINASHVGIGTTNPTVELDVDGNANISGISTLGTVKISSGIVTAVSGVVTYYGDGSNLTGVTPAGAIEGISVINQNGILVGTAGSISSLSFEGSSGVTVTGTTGVPGIATVVISAASPGGSNGQIQYNNTGNTSEFAGAAQLYYDDVNDRVGIGSSAPTATLDVNGTLNVTGVSTFQSNVNLGDNDRLRIGDDGDLQLWTDQSGKSHILSDSAGHDFKIDAKGGLDVRTGALSQNAILATNNTVQLYYDNSKKFETTVNGIAVSGIVTAISGVVTYYGDGSSLTNVDAATLVGISSTSFLRSDAADIKTSGNLTFNDSIRLQLGTGGDLELYHNGSTSYIKNSIGSLHIENQSDDGNIFIRTDDGSGGDTNYIQCNGLTGEVSLFHYGNEKLNTRSAGIDVTGNAYFGDNGRVVLGAGNDFQFYHTGTQSTINNAVGDINIENSTDDGSVIIRTDNGSGGKAEYIDCDGSVGEVKLYHYGSQKFATKSNGIDVTGHTETDTLNVSGLTTSNGIDVTGHTETDTLNVSGVSTFQSDVLFTSDAEFDDNVRVHFGTDNDFDIYHNSTHAYLQNSTGDILIINGADGRDVNIITDNGSGGTTNYFRADGSSGEVQLYHYGTEKLATKSTGIDVTGHTETDTLNVSGISTFQNSVTISGAGNTSTITGPSNLVLDPAAVGDATGTVTILGNLQVDGTQTIINSTTLEVDDKLVSIAKSATNATQANGAGLEINGASATLTYASSDDSWVFNKAPYYNSNRLLTTADEGTGNGLDADTLDNQEGTYYLSYNNFVGLATDSDKLDGQQGTYYLDYSNFSGIATDSDKLDGQQGTYYLDYSNFSGIATDSDKLDGQQGTYYLDYSNFVGVATDSSLLDGIDSTSFLRSDIATTKTSGDLKFNDGIVLSLGTNNNMSIFHSGLDSYVSNDVAGDLYLRNLTNDKDVIIQSDDGSGVAAEYFRADGSTGEAILYHYGTQKLATKSNGIAVSGIVTATSGIVTYYGDGSQLTGISAGISTTGTATFNNINATGVVTSTSFIRAGGTSSQFLKADGSIDSSVYLTSVSPTFWTETGYTGIGTTSAVGIGTRIEIIPYDTQNDGTLSFEGSAGQLFSVSNNLTTGSIFSVNDVSGIPSIDVDADGTIQLAPFSATELVGIGTTNPTAKLDVNGTVALGSSVYDTNGTFGTNGQVLSNVTGFGVSWTNAAVGGGGGISNVVEDTTPQLGGHLDTNFYDIKFKDGDRAVFGSGSLDASISHDGTNTNFFNFVGDLVIGTRGGEWAGDDVIIESADDFEVKLNTGTSSGSGTTAIYATGGGSVALNHNGSTKFETTNTGISITGNVEKYDTLVGSGSTTVVEFTVTVAAKSDHRYTGGVNGASTNGYYLDGIESPFLTFTPGRTYRFNQTDSSNSTHQIRFYLEADKTTEYTENVVTHATAGGAGAFTQIAVTESTPSILYYQCVNHDYMGNAAQTNGSTLVDGRHDTGVNASQPVHSLSAIGSESSIDVAIVPKSGGAFSLHIPDGTSTGGNKRGGNSVDLQTQRSNADEVAGSYGSFLAGLYGKVGTSAFYSAVVGGEYNRCIDSSTDCIVVGGFQNEINSSSSKSGIFAGGYNKVDNSSSAVVIGGYQGTTKGIHGIVVLPASNVPLGSGATHGAVQSTILNLSRETTDATPTVIASDSTAASTDNQLVLLNNSAVAFKGTCIAGVTGAGNTKAWEFRGAIKRGANAASTTLVGSVIKDVLAYDAGAAAWDVDFTADTTNGALQVTVTGEVAPYTIRWVCKIETTEMAF